MGKKVNLKVALCNGSNPIVLHYSKVEHALKSGSGYTLIMSYINYALIFSS